MRSWESVLAKSVAPGRIPTVAWAIRRTVSASRVNARLRLAGLFCPTLRRIKVHRGLEAACSCWCRRRLGRRGRIAAHPDREPGRLFRGRLCSSGCQGRTATLIVRGPMAAVWSSGPDGSPGGRGRPAAPGPRRRERALPHSLRRPLPGRAFRAPDPEGAGVVVAAEVGDHVVMGDGAAAARTGVGDGEK